MLQAARRTEAAQRARGACADATTYGALRRDCQVPQRGSPECRARGWLQWRLAGGADVGRRGGSWTRSPRPAGKTGAARKALPPKSMMLRCPVHQSPVPILSRRYVCNRRFGIFVRSAVRARAAGAKRRRFRRRLRGALQAVRGTVARGCGGRCCPGNQAPGT